jgi:hypothetical protein
VTKHLVIERASLGVDAGPVGAGQFALQRALSHALHTVTGVAAGTGTGAGLHSDQRRYSFLTPGTPLRDAADWRGALVGKALPGGTVTAAAFAELSAELLRRLTARHGPDRR